MICDTRLYTEQSCKSAFNTIRRWRRSVKANWVMPFCNVKPCYNIYGTEELYHTGTLNMNYAERHCQILIA